MSYVLDTNVFLQAKNLHYGFDFCPAFWDWIARQHTAGIVYSIEQVKNELTDDDAAAWAKLSARMVSFCLQQPRSLLLFKKFQIGFWRKITNQLQSILFFK